MATSSAPRPGRSARRTKWSSVSTRSIGGTQRRRPPPASLPLVGVSKNEEKRRFISFCSVLSSRTGSQRTSAMCPPERSGDPYCAQYRNLSEDVSNLEDPLPQGPELVLLLRGQVREEVP